MLYFEEREFQKRFPHAKQNRYKLNRPQKDEGNKVNIPWKAGVQVREVEEKPRDSDLTSKGPHMSAVDKNPTKSEVRDARQDPSGATRKENVAAVDRAKSGAPASSATKTSQPETQKPAPAPAPAAEKKTETTSMPSPATPSPKSDPRPPLISPITQIDPLKVSNADEPVVQELVKILNDLITVVNADDATVTNKYSAPMTKAKDSLESVAKKITDLRDVERKAAEERVTQAHKEFDEGAKQLLQRIETAQREDAARFAEEFEAERSKLAHGYDEKLKTEVERTQQVIEQRLKNELTEQAIEMKRNFISEIQSLVESERSGRLSKITDLSSNVDNLTQLTSNWNGIIDSNLATQKLQVAVDAVRSALSASTANEAKARPFVREMAALKLVAENDAIVEAAIASINPQAYQRGIPSPAQLIDRFRRVASEVRKASLLPENAGVASHAASLVLSKVMFKKHGQPQGGDVESILTRTETLLEEGDLDNAAREMNGLKGWAGVLSKDWMNDARKVLEVRQALEVIETEARLQCLRVE